MGWGESGKLAMDRQVLEADVWRSQNGNAYHGPSLANYRQSFMVVTHPRTQTTLLAGPDDHDLSFAAGEPEQEPHLLD